MRNFFLLIISLSISITAFGQGFNSVTSPDGINAIAVGNSGLIYRSFNGGITWVNTSTGAVNFYCVTSFGNDVWISGQNGNVYKTLKSNSPLTAYNTGSAVNLNGIYFIDQNTGFVCGDNGNLFKTVNGGVNWTSSNSGISSVKLNAITFSDVNNGTVAGNNGVIYKTNNSGATWTLQTSGTTQNILKVRQFNDSAVAVGEYGTLLQNNGSGWNVIDSRVKSDIRGVTGTNMTDVHLCGGGGFIRNNRNGKLNFYNFEINPMMANLSDIFYYDYNKGFAVSSLNKVIIYTSDGGNSWKMMNGASVSYNWVNKISPGSGIGNNLCRHPNDRDAFFVVYGNKIYRSGNRGDSWTQIGTITGTNFTSGRAHSFYVSPVDTNIMIAAIDNVTPDKVVRSTNYGATWSIILEHNFSSYGQPLEMDQNNPSTFYFAPDGSSTGFFKSTDNGASFTSVSNSNPFTSPCDIIVMWDSSNVLYVGDDGADIFKSSNGGVNWSLVKPSSSSEVPSMCNSVFDKSICYATTWGSSQVYRTINFGDSWNIVSNNSGSGWGSDLCHEDPNLVLTGNYGAQAYLTTNGGANFFNVDNGLSGAGAGIMVAERGLMFNMQTSSLFKLNIVYSDSVVTSNVDVQALSLVQTGTQYFENATINPQGIVKNNNGAESATFTVTRKITPGNYISTKNIDNLAPGITANVSFDIWTFNSGTTYTVKDSVYILNDNNTSNDVISGTLTPVVGYYNGITEDFSGTFPPKDWNIEYSGTNYWTYNTASSYGTGIGSAKFDYWSASNGIVQSLVTSTFNPSLAGDSVSFDNAYAPYNASSYDSLFIETSSNGGSSYTILVKMYGFVGAVGPNSLNTRGQLGSAYITPASNEWLTRKYAVPAGTNKIRFRAKSGFGNNLFIDKIALSTGGLYTQFNVKAVPEGFYNGSIKAIRDTVTVYLRNINSPYSVVDSSTVAIDSLSLIAPCVFRNAPSGTYYIHIKHRNSIETWSKSGGETFTQGLKGNYDFTSSQNQTYGNNSILVGTKYCIYGGDVNQDGVIDGTDISIIDNDASNFSTGYLITDLNGDFIIDGSDLIISGNNASNFITKITPETAVTDRISDKNR